MAGRVARRGCVRTFWIGRVVRVYPLCVAVVAMVLAAALLGLADVLTFGVGLASRRRRIPRWLIGLGTISYSVYLVHPALLAVTDGTIGRSQRDNLVLEVAFYAVLLPLCVLTYRWIEMPGRNWGKRLARRWLARAVSTRTSSRAP